MWGWRVTVVVLVLLLAVSHTFSMNVPAATWHAALHLHSAKRQKMCECTIESYIISESSLQCCTSNPLLQHQHQVSQRFEQTSSSVLRLRRTAPFHVSRIVRSFYSTHIYIANILPFSPFTPSIILADNDGMCTKCTER